MNAPLRMPFPGPCVTGEPLATLATLATPMLAAPPALAASLQGAVIEADINALLIADCRLPDMPLAYVNPAFERLTGYARAEVVGRNCRFLQGADREQPELETLRAALSEGRPAHALLRNYRKDGSLFWNELSLTPLRDADGAVSHFLGTMRDVTVARREALLLRLEHAVASSLAASDSAAGALKASIRAICETEGWTCGRYFQADEKRGVMRFGEAWGVSNEAIERYFAGSRDFTYAPGVGMVGRVWQSGQPLWVADIALDNRVARTTLATEAGLHGALAAAVHSEGRTIGVLIFHSREVRKPDERLLEAISVIGGQIGQFLQRKRAEEAQRESQELLDNIVEHIPTAVQLKSMQDDGRIVMWNKAAEAMYGLPREEAIGRNVHDLWPQADADRMRAADCALIAEGGVHDFPDRPAQTKNRGTIHVHMRKSPLYDAAGRPTHLLVIADDITSRLADHARLRENSEQLYQIANYDSESGLPNQRCLSEEITRRVSTTDTRFGLMHIELARMKSVGELFGTAQADEVVAECVRRLRAAAPEGVFLARIASDGFVVLAGTEADTDTAAALALADRLSAALAKPVSSHGMDMEAGAVIGVALFPDHGTSAATLLASAQAAMIEARDRSLTPVRLLDAELTRKLQARRELAGELQHAIESGELELHYQPCLHARSAKVVSVEALVRWRHPVRGMIPPDEFIAEAEANGLIVALGNWVLRTACRQLGVWHERGLAQFHVAVNLSSRQLRQHDLINTIRGALDEAGLAPHQLEIEMTESLLIGDSDHARDTLHSLKALGVRIALDDFGTGYSSLSYLKRYPIDVIKIDRAFVKDIATNPDDNAIVRTIISMAKSLNMETVAEGVENEAQLAILQRYGCDRIQGWYFSKALAAPDLEAWLAKPLPSLPAADTDARTLLLLDDEPNILSALRRLLRRDGYRILAANTASEAFDLLARNKVHVIISDQRMPEMSGTEFLSKVKDLYPDTVRMVLSGYTELQSVTNAINEGSIYKFLTKPWDDDNLRANIDEAFKLLEAQKQSERLQHEVAASNETLSNLNRELEGRIEERTQSMQRDLNQLYVAQEMLAHLPVAVVGIDEDGMIAAANDCAAQILGRNGASPLGAQAGDLLPAELVEFMQGCDGLSAAPFHCSINGAAYSVLCRAMGARSRAHGKMLALTREAP